MRRVCKIRKTHCIRYLRLKLLIAGILCAAILFNAYVDRVIRPTLMQLAEYEARSQALQVIHTAVDTAMQTRPDLCLPLYSITQDSVQMDAAQANVVRNYLIQAVESQLENLPEREYSIPFGSLTGNSILSGHGPGWKVQLQPEGYVQAEWRESSESLSINTTRYQVELEISVTMNMVLDGRTETLTVTDPVPLASILLRGDTPSVYAMTSD